MTNIANRIVNRRKILLGAGAGAGALTLAACDPLGLVDADSNDLRLANEGLMEDEAYAPYRFVSTEIAKSGTEVGTTGWTFGYAPDGTDLMHIPGGGWLLIVSFEDGSNGSVGVIEFDVAGAIVDAYTILTGTTNNCSGGLTPWNSFLSCQEYSTGTVVECYPLGPYAQPDMDLPNPDPDDRPAMGVFKHEDACVDPATGFIYMTEDRGDGGFYRFEPSTYGDLSSGTLKIYKTDGTWATVSDPDGSPTECRYQVTGTKAFSNPEGMCWDSFWQRVVFSESSADRVWSYTPLTDTLATVYDKAVHSTPGDLSSPDTITTFEGAIFAGEDRSHPRQVVLVREDGDTHPVVELDAPTNTVTEMAGVVFESSRRMYVISQDGNDTDTDGRLYEIKGYWGPLHVDPDA